MTISPSYALRYVELVERLRSEEYDAVTLECDNPDFGGPACAISCCGAWTDYEPRCFNGETILECLEAAIAARFEPTKHRT